MNTISLKLLLPNFTHRTKFERLPYELIEYIIQKFIMYPQYKYIINKQSYKICLNGTLNRIKYIFTNFYKLQLKLEIMNHDNIEINYKDIINDIIVKYINDSEYVLSILNTPTK